MMEWFRRRDPVMVAIVVTIIGALVVLASLNLNRLPFVNSSVAYQADFANAAGLQEGDDVRVAGISVGNVTSIAVHGDHVRVGFTVASNLKLGGSSGASIELATVLGALFLQVESAGPGRLAQNATIPVARTTVPFTLIDAFNELGATTTKTDLPTFHKSLEQLASTLHGLRPGDVTATLKGLTSISNAIASRQDEISGLLRDAGTIIKTLSSKRVSLIALMGDADTFVRMLHARRDAINNLLQHTADLGKQLSVLIEQNGAKLGAALGEIDAVTGVLGRDRTQLTAAITQLGQFSTNIANVTGSGPWIDVMLPTFLQPDNIIAACGQNPAPGCGR
ncbi:MAG: MCE family protein [Jatrophihabitans sp.]